MLHQPTLRVLDILEFLALHSEPKTLTEISVATDISKATIFPILKTLSELNYITVDSKIRYSLGLRVGLLTKGTTASNLALSFIHNEMQKIVDQCNEVCQLGILDGKNILYIDKIQSTQAIQHTSYIGTKLSALDTALGKVLLSYETDERIFESFQSIDKTVLKNLQEIRSLNFAIDDRAVHKDTKCYAVAICKQDYPIAAISVSYPYYRDSEEKKLFILECLFTAKNTIETMLHNDLPNDFKLIIQ